MKYTDQTGFEVFMKNAPRKIISLVPSQSEYLWHIGLQNELVGVTKFCVNPVEMYKSIERVGGTKNPDIEKISKLNPDLIIGNKEENTKESIEILRKKFPVWLSDVNTLNDALEMMLSLGKICDRETHAQNTVALIKQGFKSCENVFLGKTCVYLMWKKPYMAAASNTFINDVLKLLGFINLLNHKKRYPETSIEELVELKPDYCLLSTEPYPFKETDSVELKKALKNSNCVLVDGEIFSWYGSRLLNLPIYIEQLKNTLK